MSLFNFSQEEILTFFAVLVRYSVLIAVLPFVGDKFVPVIVKILLSLAISIALFPSLVSHGIVNPGEAIGWSASAGGIVLTIGLEALFGLALGFTAKLLFDAIHFGANLTGNFMGFAMASIYDPHQETQTEVVAEMQMTVAMLIFLALDGHHIMLRAGLDSYRIVGLGKAGFGSFFSKQLVEYSGQVLRFGLQIAAPMAISLFTVNVAFGVIAKALPQMNVLILSLSATAFIGLIVMFIGLPEFQTVAGNILSRMDEWMTNIMVVMAT